MVETLGVARPTDQCKKKPMGAKKDRAAQIQSTSREGNFSRLRIQAVFMSWLSPPLLRDTGLIEACLRAGAALHLRVPSDPLRPPQPFPAPEPLPTPGRRPAPDGPENPDVPLPGSDPIEPSQI
jgi:hypothetical protein